MSFRKIITLPENLRDGQSKLQVEISFDNYSLSKEVAFQINPAPAVSLGGGLMLTYPEILSRLGTISISLLLSLIFWLILFSREYWLYLHSLRNITEKHLEKLGLISMRKGREVFK
jgi:hypothetical protein